MDKIRFFDISFLINVLRHSFLELDTLLLIIGLLTLVVCILISSADIDNSQRLAIGYACYLTFAGFLFAIIVTIARGSAIDSDYSSGSYPTFTGLIWLGICFLYISTIFSDVFPRNNYSLYLIIPITMLFYPTINIKSEFYANVDRIKQERKWHNIAYLCRRVGFLYRDEGFNVSYSKTCGMTYPNEEKPYLLWSKFRTKLKPLLPSNNRFVIKKKYQNNSVLLKICSTKRALNLLPSFIRHISFGQCPANSSVSKQLNKEVSILYLDNKKVMVGMIDTAQKSKPPSQIN